MLVATIKTDVPSLGSRIPEDRKNLLKRTQHKIEDNDLDNVPHITVTGVEVNIIRKLAFTLDFSNSGLRRVPGVFMGMAELLSCWYERVLRN